MGRKCEHGNVILSGNDCKDCTILTLKRINSNQLSIIQSQEQLILEQNEVIKIYIERMKSSKINRLTAFTSLKYQAIIKLVSRASQAIFK